MYPAPREDQYFVCEWVGRPPTLMPCAPGTIFFEYRQICDKPYEEGNGGGDGGNGGGEGPGGEEGNGGGNENPNECECPVVSEPPPVTTTTVAPPTTTTTVDPCICETEPNPGPGQTTTPTNPPPPPTTTPGGIDNEPCVDNGGFICPAASGRMYVNPNDRHSYFICPFPNRCSLLMPCALGTVFDYENQICDWP